MKNLLKKVLIASIIVSSVANASFFALPSAQDFQTSEAFIRECVAINENAEGADAYCEMAAAQIIELPAVQVAGK